jgi:hypothetical protein
MMGSCWMIEGRSLFFAGLLSFAACGLAACGGSTENNGNNGSGGNGNAGGPVGGSGARAGAASGGNGTNGGGGTGAQAGDDPCANGSCAGAPPVISDPMNPCYGGCTNPNRPLPGPKPVCPEAEPSAGDDCPQDELLCSYGETAEASCRQYWRCTGDTWEADEIAAQTMCKEIPEGFCPATTPAQMDECTVSSAGKGVPCIYPEVSCYCLGTFNAQPGSTGRWACFGPPSNPSCPAELPNIGDGCNEPGVECNYSADPCTGHPYSSVFCFEGAWEVGSGYPCVGF